jgi:hypothetical protein
MGSLPTESLFSRRDSPCLQSMLAKAVQKKQGWQETAPDPRRSLFISYLRATDFQ